jgi:8-oxo-dGTP pyrophosphatase MutT (NUDIX family)
MFSEADLARRLPQHQASWEQDFGTETMTDAAVLIPLFYKEGQAHVLLTRRTDFVSHHKGQISFPGGKFEPNADLNLAATALRESWEEVGLRVEDVRLLGQMQPMPTLTRFMIYPFVGVIPYPYPFQSNPGEIDTLIEVPLAHLLNPQYRRTGYRSFAGKEYQIYYFDYLEFTIWGITGHLLHDFLLLLNEAA